MEVRLEIRKSSIRSWNLRMTEIATSLRIIANDWAKSVKLSKVDRVVIENAANELEDTQRQLAITQDALLCSQQMRIALSERVHELNSIVPRPYIVHWHYR